MRLHSTPSALFMVLFSSAALTACGGGGSEAPAAGPAPVAAAPAAVAAPAADSSALPAALPAAIPAAAQPDAATLLAATTTSGLTLTSPTPPTNGLTLTTATAPTNGPTLTSPPANGPTLTSPPPATGGATLTNPPTTPVIPAPMGAAFTDVTFQNTSTSAQANVPLTFGHAFAVGDVPSGQTIIGQLADGTPIPLQADIKARHADGSVRHAIISLKLPQLAASASTTLRLLPGAAGAAATAVTPQAVLDAGLSTMVNLDIGGVRYSASADKLLRSGAYKTWLSGALTNEWLVNVPLTTEAGVAHPHLMARFAIRAVSGSARARVDVTIENGWAFEAAPQNFTYDAQIMVGGQAVFTKAAMAHYHHARWRKVFWWGGEPQVHIKHNVGYLINTRAVPNYDRTLAFTDAKLTSWKTMWAGTKVEPMGVGIVNPYMGTTGGRDEIGLMPAWYAAYVLTMDKRVKDVTLGSGDLAGSWSTHYRDKITDRPVSIAQFPYMSTGINTMDNYNPTTKKFENFPKCATTTACTTPYSHDTSHQSAFAFVPYLVTGDYYYLEELQFWASFNGFASNPGYREMAKGLVKSDQVRGQAWSLRTLGEVSYISPDGDPLKTQFAAQLKHNIDWYDANYTNNPAANKLGILSHGYAVVYDNSSSMSPWMDDFFTASIGHLVDLGFSQAKPLLNWKSQFAISRMTAPGTCWVTGAVYALKVRDNATAAFYPAMAQAYQATNTPAFAALPCGGTEMAASLKLKVGEMTGYSAIHTGYPSNMQPALAYAAEALGAQGADAWAVFTKRSVKPNYALGPQFAIVPR